MTNKLRSSLAIILFATIAYIGAFDFDSASAATISMTTSGAQSIDVMPDNSSNVGTNIGVDNINVVTDCRAGYNLSMSASVSDNNLYLNGNSSNNQSGTYFSPANGTSTLANSPNTWGYLLSDTTPTSSSVFSAVPTNANPAILKTTATTASASNINDSFNVYFGVAMNNSLAPGTYKMIPDTNNSNADGSITYYLTMDTSCETRTITYNANNGSGSISPQVVQSGSSVVLADNAFTRTNYYFKGWATSSGGSVAYRPSQTITPTGDMALYAVWGNSTTTTLYNAVASLTRGNQTNDTNATTGIKTNPTKATSGVYTYNASVFGTSSDSANTSAIYYYRGILDTDLDGTSSTYGSNGNSMNYPNYVKLGDMCWRIVRTTGSGGVKMIYNGSYSGGTTANSCANATTNAQLTTKAFGGTSAVQSHSIVSAGYTRNNTYASTTTATAYSTLFGTDSNFSANSTNSTMKDYIENTWYASNMTSWTSKLEASAGYCNDRTLYPDGSYAVSNRISDSTTIVPYGYGTSSMTEYRFGAYARNNSTSQAPSLNCPRGTVDLYRYVSGGSGTGNQLKYPTALLTADEASFAGSGSSTASQGSGYNFNSYLNAGSVFWLLSPYVRNLYGDVRASILHSNGYITFNSVNTEYGVRPVISLKSGTTIESGSGTATDPWVIEEPKTIQDLTLSQCSVNVGTNGNPSGVGDEIAVVDVRDGSDYTVRYINGECWMTQNLRLTGGTNTLALSSTYSNVSSYTMPAESTSNFASNTGYTTDGHTCSTDTSTGCWYNYYSATGGTISGSSNSTAASSDICPKNWHLPTGPSTTSGTDFNKLVGNTTSGWQDPTTGLTAFGAVAGGYYYRGSLSNTGAGYWWSATASDTAYRYYLGYNSSNGQFSGSSYYYRYRGLFVRCVRSS